MALSARSAALACRRAFMSSIVLASQTVQVTIEAMTRPAMTTFTTTSAPMNIPHGDRSLGRTAAASTGGRDSCELATHREKPSTQAESATPRSWKYLRWNEVISVPAQAQEKALHDANIIFKRRRISNSALIGMTCGPVDGYTKQASTEAVVSHCSGGVRRSACLECEVDALENLRGL